MEKYFEAIKRCPIFADISSEEITAMLNCLQGKKESYEKGSCILQIGDKLEAVGLLERAAPVPRPLSPWRSHNLRTFGNGAPGGSPEECER